MIDPPSITLEELAARQRAKLEAIAAVTGGEVPEIDIPKDEDDMQGKAKPIECVETGERWRSMAAFREGLGIRFDTAKKLLDTGEQHEGRTYRYADIPPEAIDAQPSTPRRRRRSPSVTSDNVEPVKPADLAAINGHADDRVELVEPATQHSRAKIVFIEVSGDEQSVRAAIDVISRIMQERGE